MPALLHLDSSARRASLSRELGGAVAASWRAAHPDGRYTHRDLAADPVPPIGQAWTELCDHILEHRITDTARYREAARTTEQKAAWAIVEPLLDELTTADTVLISAPMYNYSVPATLKAWLDQVTFPRMSLAGRKFVIVSARGGAYGPGTPREAYDHHERYLRHFLAGHYRIEADDTVFLTTDLANARLDPDLAGHRHRHDQSHAAALADARRLGGLL